MKDTVLARAVRNYEGGISEMTLLWRGSEAKFGIDFLGVHNSLATKRYSVPDKGVGIWLEYFTRDQTDLEPTSYYITTKLPFGWKTVVKFLEALC